MVQAPTPDAPLRIASRQSPLAVAQAKLVQDLLADALGILNAEKDACLPILTYVTTGDKVMSPSLADEGGKGLFTKEVEDALLSGAADIAVHSMKDMPASLPDGLTIVSVPPRAAPNDAFVTMDGTPLAQLPKGAVVGSSSTRRRAQLARLRPDLRLAPMRGNVGTRLKKLAAGEADGTFLAEAGLRRLENTDVRREVLGISTMLPAIGQGTLCIEARTDDMIARAACALINCQETALRNTAERALLEDLDGNCRTPMAGHATLSGQTLSLQGEILTPDGQKAVTTQKTVTLNGDGPAQTAAANTLGRDVADALRRSAGPDLAHMLASEGGL